MAFGNIYLAKKYVLVSKEESSWQVYLFIKTRCLANQRAEKKEIYI